MLDNAAEGSNVPAPADRRPRPRWSRIAAIRMTDVTETPQPADFCATRRARCIFGWAARLRVD